MMIDYNVSDHWSQATPRWLKSLVSSLDRRHGVSNVLPLTVIVAEIEQWVQLASGVDAWKPGPNRESLRLDLEESMAAIGVSLRAAITAPLATFQAAFSRLISSPRPTLAERPGMRGDPVWTDVSTAATAVLAALESDDAAGASWQDLVAAAQDDSLEGRDYRPIAELLFEQIRTRGHDVDSTTRELVSIMAYGRSADDISMGEKDTPLTERLSNAKALLETPADDEPIVVWLGYKGHVHRQLESGRVSFYDALWAVPNAEPGRAEFALKGELWEIVQHGLAFGAAKLENEESDVETIVRVDLGVTIPARAVERATAVVDTILSIAVHRSGGTRPRFAEYHTLRSGLLARSGNYAVYTETVFSEDTYGAGLTANAIEKHAPRIADALAREELPRFLGAAIEAQAAAEHPFSRDMALREPSQADINSVIPLADRVVQHVAAHAGMRTEDLFDMLGKRWAHARWRTDLQRAANMCMLRGGGPHGLLDDLESEWMMEQPAQPRILFLAERAADFLSVCRLEHERAWIARMFASISDRAVYGRLIVAYEAEMKVLGARRRRVRNALVHGNPASFAVVESVRDYAEFVSRTALYLALESFVDAVDPGTVLATRTDDYLALRNGQDAAGYWRDRVARDGWPLPV